jgi:hypothetical protein
MNPKESTKNQPRINKESTKNQQRINKESTKKKKNNPTRQSINTTRQTNQATQPPRIQHFTYHHNHWPM